MISGGPPSSADHGAFELTARKLASPSSPPVAFGTGAPGALRIALNQLRRSRLAFLGGLAIACLVLVAIFADVLASDLPLLCHLHGETFVLPNLTHPAALATYDNTRIEEEAGPADWAFYPPVRFGPAETIAHGGSEALRAPDFFRAHPLGTDERGRDVLARLVYGARTSFSVGLIAAIAFVGIGALLGALAGFYGGVLDSIVSRLVETLTAFPTLILVLVVQAVLPNPSMLTMLLAIGLTRWTEVARLVRAEVLLVGSQEYALAARALGASPVRVLYKHVLPNAVAPVLVAATFGIASVVLIEASLTFLQVGLPPPTPSWGEMLSEARAHASAWWLLALPGLALFTTVVALNLVGEALRDALDPRLRRATIGTAPMPAPQGNQPPPTSSALDQASRV